MLLTLKNIGRIDKASIELNGITVIAGENNTGKSTVGKILFCIFNSFYKIDQQIRQERQDTIERILSNLYHSTTDRITRRFDFEEFVISILKNKDKYVEDKLLLYNKIMQFITQSDENFKKRAQDLMIADSAEKICQVMSVSDEEIFSTVLEKKLESEFSGQINNIFFADETGEINLKIKGTEVMIKVKDNDIVQILNSFSLNTEIIYLDDPFALDDLSLRALYWGTNYLSHRMHLKYKLMEQDDDSSIKNALTEIIATKKIDSIMEKINTVCGGEMVRTKRSTFGYKKVSSDAVLDINNLSTGLKTFVILKTLLLNGSIEDNGTIVLDEPEIHLHPEWQLIFAELIILIQKEFNMHILLNTHSPYFLNAIEVYAAKYGIADKCKYYLAEDLGGRSNIVDVTTNIDKIYKKLARPLQDLENERYNCD